MCLRVPQWDKSPTGVVNRDEDCRCGPTSERRNVHLNGSWWYIPRRSNNFREPILVTPFFTFVFAQFLKTARKPPMKEPKSQEISLGVGVETHFESDLLGIEMCRECLLFCSLCCFALQLVFGLLCYSSIRKSRPTLQSGRREDSIEKDKKWHNKYSIPKEKTIHPTD